MNKKSPAYLKACKVASFLRGEIEKYLNVVKAWKSEITVVFKKRLYFDSLNFFAEKNKVGCFGRKRNDNTTWQRPREMTFVRATWLANIFPCLNPSQVSLKVCSSHGIFKISHYVMLLFATRCCFPYNCKTITSQTLTLMLEFIVPKEGWLANRDM